jgi:hypothetical protein
VRSRAERKLFVSRSSISNERGGHWKELEIQRDQLNQTSGHQAHQHARLLRIPSRLCSRFAKQPAGATTQGREHPTPSTPHQTACGLVSFSPAKTHLVFVPFQLHYSVSDPITINSPPSMYPPLPPLLSFPIMHHQAHQPRER